MITTGWEDQTEERNLARAGDVQQFLLGCKADAFRIEALFDLLRIDLQRSTQYEQFETVVDLYDDRFAAIFTSSPRTLADSSDVNVCA